MAEITRTPILVDIPKPHNCTIERGVLGEAAEPGQWVYLDGNNGWKKAIGSSAAAAHTRGVVISDGLGSVAFLSGQTVDIVTQGRVSGFSNMTPGGTVYVSPDTAGEGDQSAPTSGEYLCTGGYAWDDESIMVKPQVAIPAQVA